jgi:hypothetical protein
MQSFFARVESRVHPWLAGRRDLHWHLLPKPQIAHEHLVKPYAELTQHPGLVPVPAEWLHVTVLHSGPQYDASDQEIQEITTRVREAVANTGPIRLTFARPAIGNVAVECSASDLPPAHLAGIRIAQRLGLGPRPAEGGAQRPRWWGGHVDVHPAVARFSVARLRTHYLGASG